MSRSVVVVVVLVVASLSALASKPAENLVVSTVTGGDGPSVQSIVSSDSTQRVAIVNWLIDENGNLKVSNQVRDQVITLSESFFTLNYGESWHSAWFSTRTFNVLYAYADWDGAGSCYVEYRWFETMPPFGEKVGPPITPHRIAGPEARIACVNSDTWQRVAAFENVYVYLRAE